MCDHVASIVSNQDADAEVRSAAASTLLQYYDQGLRMSVISLGVGRLLSDLGLEGEIEKFSDVCDLITDRRFVEKVVFAGWPAGRPPRTSICDFRPWSALSTLYARRRNSATQGLDCCAEHDHRDIAARG
jgi:hypothetical protein